MGVREAYEHYVRINRRFQTVWKSIRKLAKRSNLRTSEIISDERNSRLASQYNWLYQQRKRAAHRLSVAAWKQTGKDFKSDFNMLQLEADKLRSQILSSEQESKTLATEIDLLKSHKSKIKSEVDVLTDQVAKLSIFKTADWQTVGIPPPPTKPEPQVRHVPQVSRKLVKEELIESKTLPAPPHVRGKPVKPAVTQAQPVPPKKAEMASTPVKQESDKPSRKDIKRTRYLISKGLISGIMPDLPPPMEPSPAVPKGKTQAKPAPKTPAKQAGSSEVRPRGVPVPKAPVAKRQVPPARPAKPAPKVAVRPQPVPQTKSEAPARRPPEKVVSPAPQAQPAVRPVAGQPPRSWNPVPVPNWSRVQGRVTVDHLLEHPPLGSTGNWKVERGKIPRPDPKG
jgi:hypothetical protein